MKRVMCTDIYNQYFYIVYRYMIVIWLNLMCFFFLFSTDSTGPIRYIEYGYGWKTKHFFFHLFVTIPSVIQCAPLFLLFLDQFKREKKHVVGIISDDPKRNKYTKNSHQNIGMKREKKREKKEGKSSLDTDLITAIYWLLADTFTIYKMLSQAFFSISH